MVDERSTGVDLSGLLAVLGEHLYSSPNVAVRELIQNGHDSINRRRHEGVDTAWSPRISLAVDADFGTLSITDSGAGLTDAEIHSYLATIGAGYTRVLRSGQDGTDFIGQFGLGFLSAFVVADEVTMTTTPESAPDQGWRYRSSGGLSYTVEAVDPGPVGSRVELRLKDRFRTLLDPDVLTRVVRRYCSLLEVPIFVAGGAEPINLTPPWRATFAEPSERRAAELAFASAFDPTFEPICTLPVVPSGSSDAVGLLWVQGGATYGTSDNRTLSVYVRGMMLDDDAKDLLPRWAGFIGGVVESVALVPTASREDLQRNGAYDAVQAALSEAVVTGLGALADREPAAWRRVLRRHNEALIGAALVDDRLFDVIAPAVTIPTTEGPLLLGDTVREGRVYITMGQAGAFEETVFRSLRTPVARGDRYGVLTLARRWAQRHGHAAVELGTGDGDRQLFTETPLPPEDQRWLQQVLTEPGEEVVPARFAPAEVPIVRVVDREQELRQRLGEDDADRRISAMALALARMYTDEIAERPAARLYVNLDCPAVAAVLAAHVMGNPRADEAAMALRALKVVLAGPGVGDLRASLAVLDAVIEGLVAD